MWTAIAGAVIGGVTSGIQSVSNNQAIERSVKNSYKAAKNETESQYRSILDQGYRLSQVSGSNIGSFINSMGFATGQSLTSAVAQMLQDSFLDGNALNNSKKASLTRYDTTTQNIKAQANSQLQSPFLSVVNGAISGFSAGAGLGGAIGQAEAAASTADAFQSAADLYKTDPVASIAQSQALMQGVSPSMLQNPSIMAPFYSNAATTYERFNTATSELNAASSLGLGFTSRNIFAGVK